jgi:hypothetical protein
MCRLLFIPRRAAADLSAAVPALPRHRPVPHLLAPVYMGSAFAHYGPAHLDALRARA